MKNMLGIEVKTGFGWGTVVGIDDKLQCPLTVKLPWGILYTKPDCVISSSFGSIGSCSLTKQGTCLILGFDYSSQIHNVIIFDEDNFLPRYCGIHLDEFIKPLPTCVGLYVNCVYGIGLVMDYRSTDDVFSVRFPYATIFIHKDSCELKNLHAIYYPALQMLFDRYLLQSLSSLSSSSSIYYASLSKSGGILSLVKSQVLSLQGILVDCNERLGTILTGSNLSEIEEMNLVSLKSFLLDASRKLDRDDKMAGSSAFSLQALKNSYLKLTDILTNEFYGKLQTMKEFVKSDPVLSALIGRIQETRDFIATRSAQITDTKSYKALVSGTKSLNDRYACIFGEIGSIIKSSESENAVFNSVEKFLNLRGEEVLQQAIESSSSSSLVNNLFGQFFANSIGNGKGLKLHDQIDRLMAKPKEVLSLTNHKFAEVVHKIDELQDDVTDGPLLTEDDDGHDVDDDYSKSESIVKQAEPSPISAVISIVVLLLLNFNRERSLYCAPASFPDKHNISQWKHYIIMLMSDMLRVVIQEEEKLQQLQEVNGYRASPKMCGALIYYRYNSNPLESFVAFLVDYANSSVFRKLKEHSSTKPDSVQAKLLTQMLNMLAARGLLNKSSSRVMTKTITSMYDRIRGGLNQNGTSNFSMESVSALLNGDSMDTMVNRVISTGDSFLTAIEKLKENELLQQTIAHVADEIGTEANIISIALAKASTASDLNIDAMVAKVETFVNDKEARKNLVDMWKDQMLDFLIGFLPTITIPDIDGIKDDLQYHVSGLDLSGIKLRKEEVSVTLVDDWFKAITSGITIDPKTGITLAMKNSELVRIHVGGIHAVFSDIIWKYNQLFFPHLHGDGKANATVMNASLDLGFKVVRVPKGVISALASDPGGPFASSKSLFDTFSNGSVRAQVDHYSRQRSGQASGASNSGSVNYGYGEVDSSSNIPVADMYCDWGENIQEWEPAFVLSSSTLDKDGVSKLFRMEKLLFVTEQSSAFLAWLYNMLISLFEKTIKDYVCQSFREMLEGNAAVMLSFLNASTSSFFPMISKVMNISVEGLPMATVHDLQMLIGPDPNLAGFYAGPNRNYTLKFNDLGPLGLELDMAPAISMAGSSITAELARQAVIMGAVRGSQAEKVLKRVALKHGNASSNPEEIEYLMMNQLTKSVIISVNGKRVKGLEEADILKSLKVAKRPLSLGISLCDEVYAELRMMHAARVTIMRKEAQQSRTSSPVRVSKRVANTQSQSEAVVTEKEKASSYRKLKVIKTVFQEGSLGLKLKETKSCGGAVIITGFARDADGTMKQAEAMGTLEAGMIMLAVEDSIVFGRGFDEVMDIIKSKPRPVCMLFARSPDIQINFPRKVCDIYPRDLMLGIIEGYIMVTANYLTFPTTSLCEEGVCNLDRLLPGMVILQINKQAAIIGDKPDGTSITCVDDVYRWLNAQESLRLAVRDMDSFMHLIRLRDGLESLSVDTEVI